MALGVRGNPAVDSLHKGLVISMSWHHHVQHDPDIHAHMVLYDISGAKSDIDELVQERRNSSALATELHLSCTNPLISMS